MRGTYLVAFLLINLQGFSQRKIDGEFIFKAQLFLEKTAVINAKGFETKGRDLFSYFDDNIKLKPDTLQSVGFNGGYIFLSLPVRNGIIFNEKAIRSDSAFFLLIPDNCINYILCINRFNGKSYRLKGFSGNDLFNLFADVNKEKELSNKPAITIKRFLRDFGIDSVDLACLYRALKHGSYDVSKYPCLKTCGVENLIIH